MLQQCTLDQSVLQQCMLQDTASWMAAYLIVGVLSPISVIMFLCLCLLMCLCVCLSFYPCVCYAWLVSARALQFVHACTGECVCVWVWYVFVCARRFSRAGRHSCMCECLCVCVCVSLVRPSYKVNAAAHKCEHSPLALTCLSSVDDRANETFAPDNDRVTARTGAFTCR